MKTLRRTKLRRRVLWRARSRGGAVNKYTFIVFSQGFARVRKCEMHVFSQGFANMHSQKYFSFARIRKCDFACFRKLRANLQIWFRKLSHAFAIQGFASFRKDSQGFANGLSQGFAKDSQVRKSWFFARIRTGQVADVHVIDGPF